MLVELNLPPQYAADDGKRAQQFVLDFESRIRSLPAVVSVASVSGRPLSPGSTGMGIVAAERPESRDIPWASWRLISKDYFRTMGVAVLKGRTFDERDLVAKPWRIVVSRRLADQLWPGQDAVGRQVLLWKGQGNQKAEVIGVVGDSASGAFRTADVGSLSAGLRLGRGSHVLCHSHHRIQPGAGTDSAGGAVQRRSRASTFEHRDARRDRLPRRRPHDASPSSC